MDLNKNNKNKGKDFETKIYKTISSGSIWFDKGDIKTENFLIDAKYTDKKSFRITENIIHKIWNEALERNKLPKLVIGIPKNERDLFILTCNIHVIKK